MRSALAILLALLPSMAPRPAAAAPDDDACPAGKVRNEDTGGHCCWEGQAWSGLYKQCVGLAECPAGRLPTEDGEDCAALECAEGRVAVDGGCCWPGQRWTVRCVGAPRCPAGWIAEDGDCRRLEPVEPPPAPPPEALPPAETLPYVPVPPEAAVELAPGAYTRGSPRREVGRFRNEAAHRVVLTRAVRIKATEVTRREWRMRVPHDPSRFAGCGLDCPVERVSWYEALAYLNRLSAAEGLPACYVLDRCVGQPGGGCPGDAVRCAGAFRCDVVQFVGLDCPGYRLPTEAEWEYAARAGTTGPIPAGDGDLDAIAWTASNSAVSYPGAVDCAAWSPPRIGRTCGPKGVATRWPNRWGISDMLGNVAEWVWDGFAAYPRRGAVDPVQHLGLDRVVRGGGWADGRRAVRSALRARMPPDGRNATVGFRWARTVRDDVPPRWLRRPLDPPPPVAGASAVPARALRRSAAPDHPLAGDRAAEDEDLPPDEDAPEPPPGRPLGPEAAGERSGQ